MEQKNYFITFCENVRALRVLKRLSKAQMARIMGISTKTLNKIEAGQMPRLEVMRINRLLNYFHLTVEEICSIPFQRWKNKPWEASASAPEAEETTAAK